VNRPVIPGIFLLFTIVGIFPAQVHLPGLGGGSGTTKPQATAPAPKTAPPGTPAEPKAQPATAAFNYYILSLSWAPSFCADAANAAANPNECAPGKHTGFVVHGLWPEADEGQNPESCGKATQVAKRIVRMMLPYMPSAELVQHEWATHGTCSGLTQSDFFTKVIKARVSVQVPVQLTGLEEPVNENPQQIEEQFASANPSFPPNSFRTSCSRGLFTGVRVCFDLDLMGRACTSNAGECTAETERILAPR
jgi:ribonuclease T2